MSSSTARPYIFCHMLTSLDGKIMGNFMATPEGSHAGGVFYDLAFGENPYYKHQGWLSGRITTDDNFTFYEEPDLDMNAPPVPPGNYIAKKDSMYYVSIDPSGRLGWKNNTLTYGDTHAHIIEVLSQKASNSYKAFLRKLEISYIVMGSDLHDYEKTLQLLKKDFGIDILMLGGGGVLNWSFVQAGLCDELSLLLAPVADGSTETPALFSERKGLTDDHPVGFKLKEVKSMGDDTLWLRYLVKKEEIK